MENGYASQLMPFFAVILVIFLAYVSTKFISKKYTKLNSGTIIKVVERVSLGQDKMLVLVTVNNKAYFLGITDKSISKVCEFDDSEFILDADLAKQDFSSILAEGMKKYSIFNKQGKKNKNGCGK